MDWSLLADRRAHLTSENILRALTLEIDAVPNGINLGQGVCDLDMPNVLRQGAIDSIRNQRATYTPFAGIPELRLQIAEKYEREHGMRLGLDQILCTVGSTAAFATAVMTLLNPGDEIVLFEPFYTYHLAMLRLVGAVPRYVRCEPPSFTFDMDEFRGAITERTRAVLINTPCNPSGKVFTREELRGIAALLEGTNACVITDEVYEYLVYDDHEHVAPASLPELAERTLTIGGVSKTYSITGWRIGWLAGPAPFIRAAGPVFDTLDVCAARPLQSGVAHALSTLPGDYYHSLRVDYAERRRVLVDALSNAGWQTFVPQGAYYLIADYRDVFGPIAPLDAARRLIRDAGIAAVPADVFHRPGSVVHALRFHFAADLERLREVGQRLAALRP
ncbi:MAG: aminotransferase class I/II-fold pyridoxal phosphate-dependent enzyme [Planctomycetes bacterium]|nr:aminotransferase class I/II-fold pyridoxal phosphate-dependent enzyme [Planctomycetota bacterium]